MDVVELKDWSVGSDRRDWLVSGWEWDGVEAFVVLVIESRGAGWGRMGPTGGSWLG